MKEYIKPEIELIEICMSTVIATSTVEMEFIEEGDPIYLPEDLG